MARPKDQVPTQTVNEIIRALEMLQQNVPSLNVVEFDNALFWLRVFSAQKQVLEAGGMLPAVPQVPLPLPEDLRIREQNVSYEGPDDEIFGALARGPSGRWVRVILEGPVTPEVRGWLIACQRRS